MVLLAPLEKGIEGFLCRFIKRGVVVEKRFVAFDNVLQPALEFKVLVLWGKVFIGNWVRGKYLPRGLLARSIEMEPWSMEARRRSSQVGLIGIGLWNLPERVGSNKDFFRVDIFVRVPAGSPALRKDATEEERLAAMQYVVSET